MAQQPEIAELTTNRIEGAEQGHFANIAINSWNQNDMRALSASSSKSSLPSEFGNFELCNQAQPVDQHGYITNAPDLSAGIRSMEDANHLVSAAASQGLHMVNELANFLSEPNAVHTAMLSVGPILDTAVNYYANKDMSTVQHDAGVFSTAGLRQVDKTIDKLSYPMDQNELGKTSTQMMPWFIPGFKKPVTRAEAAEAAGVTSKELGQLSESELAKTSIELVAKDYKQTFFEGHPGLMPFSDQIVVHHAIEQQVLENYPGLFTAKELNELGNLRGIPKELDDYLHKSVIRVEWNKFYHSHPQGAVSREQVIEKVREIDELYGNQFEPKY